MRRIIPLIRLISVLVCKFFQSIYLNCFSMFKVMICFICLLILEYNYITGNYRLVKSKILCIFNTQPFL